MLRMVSRPASLAEWLYCRCAVRGSFVQLRLCRSVGRSELPFPFPRPSLLHTHTHTRLSLSHISLLLCLCLCLCLLSVSLSLSLSLACSLFFSLALTPSVNSRVSQCLHSYIDSVCIHVSPSTGAARASEPTAGAAGVLLFNNI